MFPRIRLCAAPHRSYVLAACVLSAFSSLLQSSSAQNPFSDLQRSSSAAKPPSVSYLFPEQVTIPAGKASPVDLHFQVAPGLHVNSHNPHTQDLIPTTLKVPDESGVHLASARFPEGRDFAFAISPTEKLSVYTGEFTVHTELLAAKGEHLVQATLRFQACDNSACMPPHSIPVVLDVIAR